MSEPIFFALTGERTGYYTGCNIITKMQHFSFKLTKDCITITKYQDFICCYFVKSNLE